MKIERITVVIITILGIYCQPACPTLPNCAQCPTPAICSRCQPSYSLITNKCHLQSQKNNLLSSPLLQPGRNQSNSPTAPAQQQDDKQVQIDFIRFGSAGFSLANRCMLEWKGVCLMCGNGYEMGNGGVCIERFQKCETYEGVMCKQCESRFSTEGGQCIDRGCLSRNYYHCSTCKQGYVLNKHQNCEIEGCISYKQGVCTNCSINNILVNQTCIRLIDNCKNQSASVCLQCSPGYVVAENKCKTTSPTCNKYEPKTGRCAECKYRQLSLINGQCVDINCLDNDAKGICLACSVGYKMDENRVCVPIFQDPNCQRVNVNSCILCEETYYVGPEGRCVALPPNCIQATCKYCKKGFISFDGSCVPLTNCEKLSGNACLICQSGYSLTLLGTCIKTIPSCLEYSYTGCSRCPPNYNLHNSVCQLNTSFSDPNCNARNFKRECILCKSGFKLMVKYNNLCMMISVQCKSTNGNGQCLSCYEGYKLNEYTGDCILATPIQNCAVQTNQVCQSCANRYYLVNSMTCKEVDPLCRDYQRQLGYCLSCYEGYYLIGNMCSRLTSLARPAIAAPTPSISGNINIQNCRILDSINNSRCSVCFNGYYVAINTGNCHKVNSLCKTYSNLDGSCLTCYDGYEVKDKNCTFSAPTTSNNIGCKKLDPANKHCQQCTDRYIKSGVSCLEVSSLCKDYDRTTGACTSCYQGYVLSQSECIQGHTQNCQQASQTNPAVCKKCQEGYYVKNGGCEKVSILCGTANYKGECITCIQGYFKNNENVCIMPALGWDSGCVKYDNGGYCIQCKTGQKLNNFLCV